MEVKRLIARVSVASNPQAILATQRPLWLDRVEAEEKAAATRRAVNFQESCSR